MLKTQDEILTSQLGAQLKEADEALSTIKEVASKRKKIIDTIAEKCCDSAYINKQLGGPNKMLGMKDEDKRDFIIQNVLYQKKRYLSMISELQTKYLNCEKEKNDIAEKYLEEKKEIQRLKKIVNDLKQQASLRTDITYNNKINTESSVSQDISQKKYKLQDDNSVSGNKIVTIDGEPYDIKEVDAHLNTFEIEMIKYIASSGKSEQSEIIKGFKSQNKTYGDNAISDCVRDLNERKVINKITESTSLQSKLILLELTELGKELFLLESGKKPKLSEIEYMKRNHASLKHGYLIKQIANLLRIQGYKDVSYESEKNTIVLNDNRRYVPDIVSKIDEKTITYWEVEYAHHNDNDFFEKIDKAAKVTSTLYIVASDKKAKEKLRCQIDAYQNRLYTNDEKMKIDIYLGTANELAKKTYLQIPDNHIKINI